MSALAEKSLREARIAASQGNLDAAISRYRRILREPGTRALAHRELGRLYLRRGWYEEAERCLRAALAEKPDDARAQANLAASLLAKGRLAECRSAYFRSALLGLRACLPPFLRWQVRSDLSVPAGEAPEADTAAQVAALERLLDHGGLTDEALRPLEEAIELFPDRVECHVALARAYSGLGRVEEAAARIESALRLDPAAPAVLAGISSALHPWNNQEAERFARRALEIDPRMEAAHASLGAALWGLNRLEEAESHCREALRLNPERLFNRLNCAVILKERGRIEEARDLYRPLDLASLGSARAWCDWGNLVLESGGNPEDARRAYRRAQALSDDARAHYLEAVLDLSLWNLAAGWERYEARKVTSSEARWHRLYAGFPAWNGRPLDNRHLLVYGEQGLGDEIMFSSMLPDLRRRARRITLLCDERLGALFSRSFPFATVIGAPLEERGARAAALTDVDCHVAAGSLGRVFRRGTGDFPRNTGYLAPDSALVRAWAEKLGALGPGMKVGLSWAGGVAGTGRNRRSLELDALTPLLTQPGACWISLQHGAVDEEIARCSENRGVRIACYGGVTRDLDDLAALISSLDLVITVCNTNVHLAGALGREVWVMAPLVPEWRYGRKSERMLWYPSVSIMRQSHYGDWADVISRVSARLSTRLEKHALSVAGASARRAP